MEYTIIWPPKFEDIAWLIESKGWMDGVEIIVDGKSIHPVFYDPTRPAQDIEMEMANNGFFVEKNLIILPRVTQEAIEKFVALLAGSGKLECLL
jgi:hypothetical protein